MLTRPVADARILTATVLLVLAAGTLVMTTEPAAAVSNCPTVNSKTGAVSPAPKPGVNWHFCDLARADLSGADLTGANLSNDALVAANLTGADLSGANLIYSGLLQADLTNADLTNANLNFDDLRSTTVTGAKLAGASLQSVRSGSLTGAPLSLPAHWTVADGFLIGPTAELGNANLTGADLAGDDLTGADLSASVLTGANLSGTVLAQVNLAAVQSGGVSGTPASLPANWILLGGNLIGPGANLAGANLAGLNLAAADLSGVSSGGITGIPASLPPGWSLAVGYLVGPQATLDFAKLASADLSGLDLAGADLAGADLTGADLAGANLSGADAYQGTFANANVTSANLTKVTLFKASMVGADLARANLTDAQVENCALAGSNLSAANFTGATISAVSSGGITGVPSVLPRGWSLRDGFLIGFAADLTNADLTGADLTRTDLRYATLTGVKLAGTRLAGANLLGVTSGKVTGVPASLPAHWQLRRGFLIGPGAFLFGADFSGAKLAGDLESIQGDQASFTSANLTGADLAGAELCNSYLNNANLSHADLRGACLNPADLVGVIWSDTTCPDGSNSNSHHNGCLSALTPAGPVAKPAVASGRRGTKPWYVTPVTVDWNWSGSGLINSQDCQRRSTTHGSGAAITLTASCTNMATAGSATDSFTISVDLTRPRVSVTGVREGHTYRRGHVPRAGCRSRDRISGIAVVARLKVTTTGKHGLGVFVATCAGAVSGAGAHQEQPARVRYTVIR